MREVGALLKSRPCLLRSDQRTPEPVRIQTPQRRCVGTTHRVGETGSRPEHPLEGQTSTRVDSDVTHPLVPSSPHSGPTVRAVRRSEGRPERFVDTRLFRGCIADVVLHFNLSLTRLSLRSDRRIGETCVRSGDATERDPAGGTRCVRWGQPWW